MKIPDPLLRHSLWLIGATAVGHVGNYGYHLICGRMLPEAEYGLLMALFGGVNLLLIPMTALGVTLARAVAMADQGRGLRPLLRQWGKRFLIAAGGILGLALLLSPWFRQQELSGRAAPLLLAAAIPALNLFLTLTGAGLQGLQAFRELSIRGSLLFGVRALLVGLCLSFGFRAAGWALLAHLLGMGAALLFSFGCLHRCLRDHPDEDEGPAPPVSADLRAAVPVLLSFAVLLSADVILVRIWCGGLSGAFAQSATLGRMILWLPLPIAQAMFPKVVRSGETTSEHRNTALRAIGYTLLLVLPAFALCWVSAGPALRLVYGQATDLQIGWLRGIALAMLPLAPLHVWIHYELARGKLIRLLPVVGGAGLYLILAGLRHADPGGIITALQVSTATALLLCVASLVFPRRSRSRA